MLYLVLGGAAFAIYLWATRRHAPLLKRREWRIVGGALSLAAFTAAVFVGTRGGWGTAIVLAIVGLWFAASARKSAPIAPAPGAKDMSLDEARRILGVEQGASVEEIQAAYARLMRAVHPDKGGSAGLAAQLNAARDRLLKSK